MACAVLYSAAQAYVGDGPSPVVVCFAMKHFAMLSLLYALVTVCEFPVGLQAQVPAVQNNAPGVQPTQTILRTTVRRVVLDVVVTDSKGAPVRGLTRSDFAVAEDGQPQTVLSFEASGFNAGMDYVPPKLPPQPPNTFMNLPTTPEKGPLYVLLYDMVNMDN